MTGMSSAEIQARRDKAKRLFAQGYSRSDIAGKLNVSYRTVERHLAATGAVTRKTRPGNGPQAQCTVCGRMVAPKEQRFAEHATTPGGAVMCTNGGLPLPVAEDHPFAHTRRTNQVATLAIAAQDQDPEAVKAYLAGLSTEEVRAIAMFALAAIDLDRPKRELWPDWTKQLGVGA